MRSALGRLPQLAARDNQRVGPLRAVVADAADPLKRGHLKLIIPELSGRAEPHPQWVEPALGFGKGGGKVWGNTLALPENGDVVGVLLRPQEPDSLEDHLVWIPGWAIDGAMPAVLAVHYPRRRGLVTPSGHSLYFDDDAGGDADSGEVRLAHRDGAALTLEKGGDAALDSKGGGKVKANGDDYSGLKTEDFETALSNCLNTLSQQLTNVGTGLAAGTSGSQVAQQLVSLAAIQTAIAAISTAIGTLRTALDNGSYESSKFKHG